MYRGHRHMQECGKQGSGPRAIAYAIIRIHGSQHDRFRRGRLVGGREQEAALHGVGWQRKFRCVRTFPCSPSVRRVARPWSGATHESRPPPLCPRPGQMATAAAASLETVSHGLTLKGAQLTWCILHRHKPIENRSIRLPPGWLALHTGVGKLGKERSAQLKASVGDALPAEDELPHGAIVGAARIDRACAPADCVGTPSEPWASGPVCNVIGAVVMLDEPVPHKGALGLWRIDADVLSRVHAGLIAGQLLESDPSMLPPPEALPPPPRTRPQASRTAGSGKRNQAPSSTSSSKKAHTGAAPAATAPSQPANAFSGAAQSSTDAPPLPMLVAKLQQMVGGVGVGEARAQQALLENAMSLSRAAYSLTNARAREGG